MDNPFMTLHEQFNERFDRMEKLMEQILSSGALPAPAASSQPGNDDVLLTAEEIAVHLGITKQTVLKLVRNGVLPFYKPGRHYLFRKSGVDKAISSETPIKRKNKGGFNG
jgi:excisionase family DNA binding protein